MLASSGHSFLPFHRMFVFTCTRFNFSHYFQHPNGIVLVMIAFALRRYCRFISTALSRYFFDFTELIRAQSINAYRVYEPRYTFHLPIYYSLGCCFALYPMRTVPFQFCTQLFFRFILFLDFFVWLLAAAAATKLHRSNCACVRARIQTHWLARRHKSTLPIWLKMPLAISIQWNYIQRITNETKIIMRHERYMPFRIESSTVVVLGFCSYNLFI